MSALQVLAKAGQTETTPAAVGDLVRRAGHRRLWEITGHTGQLVDLVSADTPPAGHDRHTITAHAGDLVLVARPACPGCGTAPGHDSSCPGCGEPA